MLALLGGVAAWFQIRTYDTMFHLAAGRWIIEHQSFPRTDPFSFTFAGTTWHNHSPLAQVILFWIHRPLGFFGLTAFQAVAAGTLVLVPLLCLRSQRRTPGFSLVLPLLPILAFRETLVPRPHVLGFVLLQAFAALYWQWIRTKRPVWMLSTPVVYAAWLFVHGSHVLMPVLLAIIVFIRASQKHWRRAGVALVALVICIALTIGLRPDAFALGTWHVGDAYLHDIVPEWQPITPDILFFTWPGWTFLGLWNLSLFSLVLQSGLTRMSVANRYRLPADYLCVTAILMLIALTSRRMVPLFLIAGAPFWVLPTAAALRHCLAPLERRLARAVRVTAVWALAGALTAVVWMVPSTFNFGSGLDQERFPKAAVDYLERSGKIERLYHAYNYGGYLMYRGVPAQGVFIDGRAITVYPPDFLAAFHAVYQNPNRFDGFAGHFRADGVLLPVESARTARLITYLQGHPRWQTVYRDDQAVIFGVADASPPGVP